MHASTGHTLHIARTLSSPPALSFNTEAIWFTGMVDMLLAPVRSTDIFLDTADSMLLVLLLWRRTFEEKERFRL